MTRIRKWWLSKRYGMKFSEDAEIRKGPNGGSYVYVGEMLSLDDPRNPFKRDPTQTSQSTASKTPHEP